MSFSPLIEAMLQPGFYDHVVQSVQLIQTHISYVFLTGEFAYKVKKPVNFGFLDFSSLDKRQFFCQEELRLNKRLAPDLYLAVLPIYSHNDRFSFASNNSEPIEYVVKMRQFPQEQLLINLFERGELTFEHITTIGRQIAQFHQIAATNEHINQFGTSQAMAKVAEDNYNHTKSYIGRGQTQFQFDQTRQYTDCFFKEHQADFNLRIAQNKIRECHGDLHLKNICLWQNQIQIFDCIEFNEPFRNSDVLYDIAFLFMDLEFRGRPDFANRLLNVYLEETNDYEGLMFMPLFCSMRAYIRAKVTSFLLDDPNIPDDAKTIAQQEASAYYQLAYKYTQKNSNSPQVILTCGLSGAGKSTIARQVAVRLNAIHIRSDAIRKHLAGISLKERGDQSIYSAEMTQGTYDRLLELAQLLTEQGFTVILDAKYDRFYLRQKVREGVKFPIKIIHCVADMDILAERLERRAQEKSDIADATTDLLAKQQLEFETFSPSEIDHVIPLNTDQQIDYDGLIEKLR